MQSQSFEFHNLLLYASTHLYTTAIAYAVSEHASNYHTIQEKYDNFFILRLNTIAFISS